MTQESTSVNPYYIVASKKPFARAVEDLDAAVKRQQFGVLHVHDLGATLRAKGQNFAGECKVFEVCSPQHAAAVMAQDLRVNMALPCRISVYTEGGETKLGMVAPAGMLATLSDDPALAKIAQEVDAATRRMIDEAA